VRDLLSEELEPVGLAVDPAGGLHLTGLTRIHCTSITEVLACLDAGEPLITGISKIFPSFLNQNASGNRPLVTGTYVFVNIFFQVR
jgi:hypothetical protein